MKTLTLFLAVVLPLCATSCKGFFKGMELAKQEIAEFHKRYNDGKFSEIYELSHSGLKQITGEEEFMQFIQVVHGKLGKVTDTSMQSFNINTTNGRTTIEMVQNTTFENGKGTEQFVFIKEGEQVKIYGYHINSNDLVMEDFNGG